MQSLNNISKLTDFFTKATYEEKENVFKEVAELLSKEQSKEICIKYGITKIKESFLIKPILGVPKRKHYN